MVVAPEHRKVIRDAMKGAIELSGMTVDELVEAYKEEGTGKVPRRRVLWDLFTMAHTDTGERLYRWACRHVYNYASDDDIYQVLKRI